MDLGAGAVFGGLTVAVLLVLAIIYAVVRLRHGNAPPHASAQSHSSDVPSGDQDELPRESGSGRLMVPPEEADAMSPEQMQQRARGEAE